MVKCDWKSSEEKSQPKNESKLWTTIEESLYCLHARAWVAKIYTVGVKSISPVDIELLFVILYNITALHHNKKVCSVGIK